MLTFHRPMTVAVLCSHRAPGLLHLLTRGHTGIYKVVCCVTTERTFLEEVKVERRGIPTIPHPIADFYAARGHASRRDRGVRAEYDAATVALLARHAPDVVVLAGYSYLVTAPLLEAFRARVLGLHFADLAARDGGGRARFAGLHPVRDAIAAGCGQTRATVHVVNAAAGAGAPLVRSWPLPVSPMMADAVRWKATDMIAAYAHAHHQWMARGPAGPLLSAALRLVSTREIDLDVAAVSDAASAAPWDLHENGRVVRPAVRATMTAWPDGVGTETPGR